MLSRYSMKKDYSFVFVTWAHMSISQPLFLLLMLLTLFAEVKLKHGMGQWPTIYTHTSVYIPSYQHSTNFLKSVNKIVNSMSSSSNNTVILSNHWAGKVHKSTHQTFTTIFKKSSSRWRMAIRNNYTLAGKGFRPKENVINNAFFFCSQNRPFFFYSGF